MRAIFAAVARVLAAMRGAVFKWVRECGRWVMKLTSAPGGDVPPAPVIEPERIDDVADIKRAAGVLAQGRVPSAADLVGLSERQVAWLGVLDRRQLCRLMLANADALRSHLAGRVAIPGLPAADRVTVAALAEARKPRPTSKGYRTMRDRLREAERLDYDGEAEEGPSVWAPAL
jgi:hypothetical protein